MTGAKVGMPGAGDEYPETFQRALDATPEEISRRFSGIFSQYATVEYGDEVIINDSTKFSTGAYAVAMALTPSREL